MKKVTMLLAVLFAAGSAMAQLNPMSPIPVDDQVRTGKLENGMTYYIRHNEKPKGQADFYILHDVGAIQEDDTQQGLAHFLEHMAFNGTKNLPGKMLTEYLETVGVKFGANLNAGTSWDQTVYNICDVPTSREGIIDSALLILHDWSHFIALEPDEIDSERGVIMEELRTRDGASWRSTMKMLQAVGKGSKYEHRNLIGYLDGLKNFKHQELVDFYHRWYRPDYQAVIVVGDVDVDAVESKIKTLMSDIPAPAADAPQKEAYTVPDNEEPIVSIYTDPEMQGTRVQLFIKRPATPKQYNNLLYGELINILQSYVMTMENARLQEIAMQPDAPFLGAGMGVIPTLEMTSYAAMTKDGELNRGFEALYTEMEKVRRHGYTQGEFERAQENLMRQIERQYANRNDRRNNEYVQLYLNNYQKNSPIPDADRVADGQSVDPLARRRDGQRLRTAAAHADEPGDRRHGTREGGARRSDGGRTAGHPREGDVIGGRGLRGQRGQGAAHPGGHRAEGLAREEDGRGRRARHDGVDAQERREGGCEAHNLQGRRGAPACAGQGRSVDPPRRGVLHG